MEIIDTDLGNCLNDVVKLIRKDGSIILWDYASSRCKLPRAYGLQKQTTTYIRIRRYIPNLFIETIYKIFIDTGLKDDLIKLVIEELTSGNKFTLHLKSADQKVIKKSDLDYYITKYFLEKDDDKEGYSA